MTDSLPGGQYGYRNGTVSTSTVMVSPVPVTTSTPSGTAPVGTAPMEKPSSPSGPIESHPGVPISTGVSSASSNSPLSGTGSPSGYAPIGSGSASSSSTGAPYPIGTGAPGSGYGPIGTGPIGTGTGASTAYTTETIDTTVTSDTTLTYTVGSGASKTVVTTTVHHTSTKTQFSVSTQFLKHRSFCSNMPFHRPSMQPSLPQLEETVRNLVTALLPTTPLLAATLPTAPAVPVSSPLPFHLPPRRHASSRSRRPQAVVLRRMTALLALVGLEVQAALLKSLLPCLAPRRLSPL